MKSTIRVILPANEVPHGASISRLKSIEGNADECELYTVQNQTVANGTPVQLPDTELCLAPVTNGKPSHIISPTTEVIAHLSLEQVQSLMAK